MKKILVYFYNEELETTSTTSVTRLVASLVKGLETNYIIHYFSFNGAHKPVSANAKPVFLTIAKRKRLQRKLNNTLGFKRMHWFHLKRNAVRNYAQKNNNEYDAVLVLGLDDVKDVRNYFPAASILYWIHNISAICKKEYLYNVNDADYFLTPSRTTYQLLLQKLEPKPLTAEFCFMPNWCEQVFEQKDNTLVTALKEKHAIAPGAKVFIFAGSDLKIKGRFIIEKVLKKLAAVSNDEIIFFFAGSDKNKGHHQIENIRVIDVGLLPPAQLAAYYRIAGFGCFSSLAYDHCPLTLLEMINCDVLPLASDVGSVKEILGADYPYLVEEPNSVDNWISVIYKAMLLSESEKKRIVHDLKQKINSVYNRNNALQVMENILK